MIDTTTRPGGHPASAKYLTFRLSESTFGIPILHVREIIAVQPITPLPRMSEAVKGVINLRGKIIPVLDLRLRLGLEARPFDRSTCIVVLDVEGADGGVVNVGCIVDAVREVSDVGGDDVHATPEVGGRGAADHILGLAKNADSEFVTTLLDVRLLLADLISDPELVDSVAA